jgi:hypothetical protein
MQAIPGDRFSIHLYKKCDIITPAPVKMKKILRESKVIYTCWYILTFRGEGTKNMLKKLQLKDKYNHSQEVIIEYLKNGLKEGKQFFKSKYIARDLGMSPKEVGTNMKILSDECEDLHIEKWSYSKSTTWRVETTA